MQKELKIILVSSTLLNLAAGLFGPLYAAFVEEIGGGLVVTGASYAVYTTASGFLVFFISRWEDHVKHQEKLVIFGRGLVALAFFGYLLISKPIHLFIVQGVLGIAFAVSAPALQSIYSKHLDDGKYASQWGLWEALIGIAAGIAALAGGFVAEVYGFRVLFWFMFLFSVASLLYSFRLLRKPKGKSGAKESGYRRLVPNRRAGSVK